MEHLRGAGLIAGPVVEEVGGLRLGLRLALERARAASRLCARAIDAMNAVRSASCVVCSATSWLPDWAAWSAPVADWLDDTSALICVRVLLRFCTTPACTRIGVLKAGERVLPARLRVGEELLRGRRAGVGLRIGLRERLIDRR